MWLVVGLGNPGKQYCLNRHNIGFMVVDRLAAGLAAPPAKNEAKAEVCKFQWSGRPVLLVKPQSYMNLSGQSVRALMDYYKIEKSNLLVVHDDIDQQFPQMKLQRKRGAGGHNGIKSLIEQLGDNDFARLKIGVGRPSHPGHEVADYVLQNFSQEQLQYLDRVLDRAGDAVEAFIFKGFDKAAGLFNQKFDWPPRPE